MTKMWDDLKNIMKEWSSVAVEKAEEVSKKAVAKTEELTKISKLKLEVHQMQRDRAKTYENLGRLVAFHAKEENVVNFTGNKEFYDSLKKIDEIQEKINIKNQEIQNVKDEYDLKESEIAAAEKKIKEKPEENEISETEDKKESEEKTSDSDSSSN